MSREPGAQRRQEERVLAATAHDLGRCREPSWGSPAASISREGGGLRLSVPPLALATRTLMGPGRLGNRWTGE